MKFILTVPIALFFTACPYPSHLIRVNESLPKNAPVEKETIVLGRCHISGEKLHREQER